MNINKWNKIPSDDIDKAGISRLLTNNVESWLPDEATANTFVENYDFKPAKILAIKLEAKSRIETIVPPELQARDLSKGLRLLKRVQDGEALTADQDLEIAALVDTEVNQLGPIRSRSNELEAQVDALASWQEVVNFDVQANW